jgi:hypothetical protein
LSSYEGTIITGSVRSGTTLALRVFCPDLTAEEEKGSSAFNEPQPLSNLIVEGNVSKALRALPLAMLNRHHMIKSPHVAFIMPLVRPKYKVIMIFRDLRLVVSSILDHPWSRKYLLGDQPFWLNYAKAKTDVPIDVIGRAAAAAEQFYTNIAHYGGPLEIWNYGFWEEWRVRNQSTEGLYGRENETSVSVLEEVKRGKIFADSRFTERVWADFCAQRGITKDQQSLVVDANERIRELFEKRGLEVKTLDTGAGMEKC